MNKKGVEKNIGFDESDVMDDEEPKDDDTAPRKKRKQKRAMEPLTVTKRQKQNMMENIRLHWVSLLEGWSVAQVTQNKSYGMVDQCTDCLSVTLSAQTSCYHRRLYPQIRATICRYASQLTVEFCWRRREP